MVYYVVVTSLFEKIWIFLCTTIWKNTQENHLEKIKIWCFFLFIIFNIYSKLIDKNEWIDKIKINAWP